MGVVTRPVTLGLDPPHNNAFLHYLEVTGGPKDPPKTDLAFLHYVRDPRVAPVMSEPVETGHHAYGYYMAIPEIMRAYRVWAERCTPRPDLVARLPSRRHDAEPVAAAVASWFCTAHGALDLSPHLYKTRPVRAGEMTHYGELLPYICCTYRGRDLADKRYVVLVDDVYSDGKTASAVLVRLRDLDLPTDARVSICAPLWMPPLPLSLPTDG